MKIYTLLLNYERCRTKVNVDDTRVNLKIEDENAVEAMTAKATVRTKARACDQCDI